MSQAPEYDPQTEFLTYQAQQAWFPGQNLDVEFNALATSVNSLRLNLSYIQKDDGTIGNGIVGWDQLSPAFQLSLRQQNFQGAPTSGPNTWIGVQTFPNNVVLGANLLLPQTNASGTAGVIMMNGGRFIHNATNNLFIGPLAGNFTLTGPEAFENLGIGASSLAQLTSGGQNTAINQLALFKMATGFFNVAVGYNTLPKEVSGSDNTAVGTQSLLNQNGASSNIAIGSIAGINITTGSFNVIVGFNTAGGLTTGSGNVILGSSLTVPATLSHAIVIGDGAGTVQLDYNMTNANYWTAAAFQLGTLNLPTTTSASNGTITVNGVSFFSAFNNNTFLGSTAGNYTLSGTSNVGIGGAALALLSSGVDNTALGYTALEVLTTGQGNTAIGLQAMLAETTGSNSTAVGKNALLSQRGGSSNVAVGFQAGQDVTSGSNNTIVGNNTGRGITTGGTNTILGANISGLSAALAGAIILSDGGGNIKLDYGNTTASTWTSSATINLAAGVLKMAGTQVVSTRATGWTVATGTPQRSTFTTSGVTLAQLAGVVMALEQDLIAHGLIGT